MQSTGRARLTTRRAGLVAGLAATALLLTACGTGGLPGASTTPTLVSATASPGDTGSPGTPSPGSGSSGTDSPGSGSSGTESPGTASPTPNSSTTASPGGDGTPGSLPSFSEPPTPAPTLGDPTGTPGQTAAPVSCRTLDPVRVEKVTGRPRRTTEVISVVSDGRTITSGTREQTDFTTPTLQSPDGTPVTDKATTTKIATLIEAGGKNRVLLSRPAGPDADISASKRPFDTPGTYALYNASAVLDADVVMSCNGQQQRWTFTAEADNTVGQVNCAVEPPRTNAIARSVYTNNC